MRFFIVVLVYLRQSKVIVDHILVSFINHRHTFPNAVSNQNLVYCLCNHNTCEGIGSPSAFPFPLKNKLFRRNSATPCSGFTSVDISNNPSDSRTSAFRGESPHRTTIRSGVFSTTSKWSVMRVPTS